VKTLRRAKSAIGVEIDNTGFQGPSFWKLPETREAKGGQAIGGHPNISDLATFEESRSTSGVSSSGASKDGHGSDMAPFDDAIVIDYTRKGPAEDGQPQESGALEGLTPGTPEFLRTMRGTIQ
jgi:hypothetical protein